ncbi:hypothetical protein K450DRAFT_230264 [Umbelopsis ramanniana AG]|uniref:Glycerophosphodiester phosphodiesterase n=1 Tax=Umbelopsis ramanniana AG TaxID=1314678 RepID=A0AAD5EFC0_UMBRA|nr:uncharacterized protein K450DRAFT_230264 [Umbelopsis ramanniana AG]KAI8581990.1 hypothetical protein K450DRAFT_230264 [Umbelopsis ramanniana AG]
MKFGKTLLKNQIPEWSRNYINYKALKKRVNRAAEEYRVGQQQACDDSVAAIFFALDRELEKVNGFYTYKRGEIDRRLALKETLDQLNKLMWFAELNNKGFGKILKKLDKRLKLVTRSAYLETKVDVLPFATYIELKDKMDTILLWINVFTKNVDGTGQQVERAGITGAFADNSLTSRNKEELLNKTEMEQLNAAIGDDDTKKVQSILAGCQFQETDSRYRRQLLNKLLEVACKCMSLDVVSFLLDLGASPASHDDVNERNLLHKLCIQGGQLIEQVPTVARTSPVDPSLETITLIEILLRHNGSLTSQSDILHRKPLHYAAMYGFARIADVLLQHSVANGEYSENQNFTSRFWVDHEGYSPLFYAILNGRTEATRVLIARGDIKDIDNALNPSSTFEEFNITNQELPRSTNFPHDSWCQSPLAIACKIGNARLTKLLIEVGANLEMKDEDGETPLYFAARNGHVDCIEALLREPLTKADINVQDTVNGYTPLMVAAIEGNASVVEKLVAYGADINLVDFEGWNAHEHAIFRGFTTLSELLKPASVATNGDSNHAGSKYIPVPEKRQRKDSATNAVRVYGHKYLKGQTMVIVTLGSNDVRNQLCTKFVNLEQSLLQTGEALSIVVSATNATGEFPIIDLPPPDSQNYGISERPEPIVLFTTEPHKVVLKFDVVPTLGAYKRELVARGTALLASDQITSQRPGQNRYGETSLPLRGQLTVPLIDTKSLEFVGSLGAEYLVVTPFEHPHMKIGSRQTYYKSVDTKVIGHRGLGMNKRASRLQVGENTVLSFVTAASLGAEYVEFDVQLTKDLVPVIYHDWTLTESGFDIPINAVSAEQFLNLRPSGHIKEYHQGVTSDRKGSIVPTANAASNTDENILDTMSALPDNPIAKSRINRSNSLSALPGGKSDRSSASKRLDLTKTNKTGKVKGNGPESIQAPFTTLAEIFRQVPKDIGFNIEVKYPMVDEAEQDDLQYVQELNLFVDTILECVYEHTHADRKIIFSSFHPDIALLVNMKQPNYPVFFLTDAGTLPMADVRCNSIQEAIRFAKGADLLGIVTASEPILAAPRMAKVIKQTGLLLFTYGVLNNEVVNAKAQQSYGVDAVIVDSVLAVRKGLQEISE